MSSCCEHGSGGFLSPVSILTTWLGASLLTRLRSLCDDCRPGAGLPLGQPQGLMRAPGEAGPEECSPHIRSWKNKHGDGPCALSPGKCACTRRAQFVCFLTTACGFVSASPRDGAWGRAHEREKEGVRVCVCVRARMCWGQCQAHERGPCESVCVCAYVSVPLGVCVSVWCGGRSELGIPPRPTPRLSRQPLTLCLSLFALLRFFNLATLRGSTKVRSFPSASPPHTGPGSEVQRPRLGPAGAELPGGLAASSTWACLTAA